MLTSAFTTRLSWALPIDGSLQGAVSPLVLLHLVGHDLAELLRFRLFTHSGAFTWALAVNTLFTVSYQFMHASRVAAF